MATKKKPLSNAQRTRRLRDALERAGPLHVRALVPDYALRDFELGNYPPFLVGHVDPERLTDEQLLGYVGEYRHEGCWEDRLEGFARFLEGKGYLALTTAAPQEYDPASRGGFTLITTDKE